MDRYLTRICPRCGGHVGIYMNQPEQNTPLQAVNGHCVRCSYRLVWIVIRGRRSRLMPKTDLTSEPAEKVFGWNVSSFVNSTGQNMHVPNLLFGRSKNMDLVNVGQVPPSGYSRSGEVSFGISIQAKVSEELPRILGV